MNVFRTAVLILPWVVACGGGDPPAPPPAPVIPAPPKPMKKAPAPPVEKKVQDDQDQALRLLKKAEESIRNGQYKEARDRCLEVLRLNAPRQLAKAGHLIEFIAACQTCERCKAEAEELLKKGPSPRVRELIVALRKSAEPYGLLSHLKDWEKEATTLDDAFQAAVAELRKRKPITRIPRPPGGTRRIVDPYKKMVDDAKYPLTSVDFSIKMAAASSNGNVLFLVPDKEKKILVFMDGQVAEVLELPSMPTRLCRRGDRVFVSTDRPGLLLVLPESDPKAMRRIQIDAVEEVYLPETGDHQGDWLYFGSKVGRQAYVGRLNLVTLEADPSFFFPLASRHADESDQFAVAPTGDLLYFLDGSTMYVFDLNDNARQVRRASVSSSSRSRIGLPSGGGVIVIGANLYDQALGSKVGETEGNASASSTRLPYFVSYSTKDRKIHVYSAWGGEKLETLVADVPGRTGVLGGDTFYLFYGTGKRTFINRIPVKPEKAIQGWEGTMRASVPLGSEFNEEILVRDFGGEPRRAASVRLVSGPKGLVVRGGSVVWTPKMESLAEGETFFRVRLEAEGKPVYVPIAVSIPGIVFQPPLVSEKGTSAHFFSSYAGRFEVSPDGKRLLAIAPDDKEIRFYDLEKLALTGKVKLDATPLRMMYGRSGTLYVLCREPNEVSVVSTTRHEVTKRIALSLAKPAGFALAANGSLLYVSGKESRTSYTAVFERIATSRGESKGLVKPSGNSSLDAPTDFWVGSDRRSVIAIGKDDLGGAAIQNYKIVGNTLEGKQLYATQGWTRMHVDAKRKRVIVNRAVYSLRDTTKRLAEMSDTISELVPHPGSGKLFGLNLRNSHRGETVLQTYDTSFRPSKAYTLKSAGRVVGRYAHSHLVVSNRHVILAGPVEARILPIEVVK